MIRKYLKQDFDRVKEITLKYWGKEVPMTKELETFIYDFLVRYYLYDNEYTFVNDDDEVNAFLLANMKNDKNEALNFFKKEVKKLSFDDRENAKKYLDYIEYNHNKVFSHMENNSIYLGLLASEAKGAGSKLIEKLKEEARKNNVKSIYLWTDETCNYKYYEKRDFKLIEKYDVFLYSKKLETYVYKIELYLKK